MPDVSTVSIHGHRRAFRMMGSGPAVLLIHGIGSRHQTWLPVMTRLAEDHTVIAPDLLGHGLSDKPRADYSIGGYANAMRDLLTVLGVDRVTVVGHSLGGGIAMQFAYQYPQRTERFVLVASGGLGREVNPMLRAVTLPGAGPALAAVTSRPIRPLGLRTLDLAYRTGWSATIDARPLSDVYSSLENRAARAAMRHVMRAVVDWRGQVVTMRDRAYLAAHMPSMIVWGSGDTCIPVRHAQVAAQLFPGSRLEIFDGAGHFPHEDHPAQFSALMSEFVASTEPSRYDARRWKRALASGARPIASVPRQADPIDAPKRKQEQAH